LKPIKSVDIQRAIRRVVLFSFAENLLNISLRPSVALKEKMYYTAKSLEKRLFFIAKRSKIPPRRDERAQTTN
jgi:hypothetical protein